LLLSERNKRCGFPSPLTSTRKAEKHHQTTLGKNAMAALRRQAQERLYCQGWINIKTLDVRDGFLYSNLFKGSIDAFRAGSAYKY